MTYKNITHGTFVHRPNRFIAICTINGIETVCHVKNTGRCRELLVPGAAVLLSRSSNPGRKTAYDLIAVWKGSVLINMDSQAPNLAAPELLRRLYPSASIRPETTYKDSRFDFFLEDGDTKMFIEVKGVTLEKNGLALFPDAPTERGVKHLKGLASAVEDGYKAAVLFLIQMKSVSAFAPHEEMHPSFGFALRDAAAAGVEILAYDCIVTEDSMIPDAPVTVLLTQPQKL